MFEKIKSRFKKPKYEEVPLEEPKKSQSESQSPEKKPKINISSEFQEYWTCKENILLDPKNESFFCMLKNSLFASFTWTSITSFIILINIACFVATLYFYGINQKGEFLELNNYAVFMFGENYPFFVHQFEIQRLLFSLVLHKNLTNLLISLMSFLIISCDLEAEIGKKNLVVAYSVGGVIGNLFGDCFTSRPSVGCAPAIFALIGYHAYLLIIQYGKNPIQIDPDNSSLFLAAKGILLLFMLGIGVPWFNQKQNLGGIIAGFLLGLCNSDTQFGHNSDWSHSMIGKILLMIFILLLVFYFFLFLSPTALPQLICLRVQLKLGSSIFKIHILLSQLKYFKQNSCFIVVRSLMDPCFIKV